jgi:hypothetical protein
VYLLLGWGRVNVTIKVHKPMKQESRNEKEVIGSLDRRVVESKTSRLNDPMTPRHKD